MTDPTLPTMIAELEAKPNRSLYEDELLRIWKSVQSGALSGPEAARLVRSAQERLL